jgi:hypothetical protein
MSSPQHSLWERSIIKLVAFLDRFKIVVALFYLAVLAVSAAFAPKLLANTSSAYDPPTNTEAHKVRRYLVNLLRVVAPRRRAERCTKPAGGCFARAAVSRWHRSLTHRAALGCDGLLDAACGATVKP